MKFEFISRIIRTKILKILEFESGRNSGGLGGDFRSDFYAFAFLLPLSQPTRTRAMLLSSLWGDIDKIGKFGIIIVIEMSINIILSNN